jgi:hypothetical protein
MQADAQLKALVEQFAGLTVADAAQMTSLAHDIMVRWHGASSDQHNDRGAYADGTMVAVFESMFDTVLTQWRAVTPSNPAPLAAAYIQAEVDLGDNMRAANDNCHMSVEAAA